MLAYAAVRGAGKAPDKARRAAPVKPRAGKSTTTVNTNTNTTKTVCSMAASSRSRRAGRCTGWTKQYAGNVSETLGGIILYFDKDIVGGPVAH